MKLTENQIRRIVKKVISEQTSSGIDDSQIHKLADYAQAMAHDDYLKARRGYFDDDEKFNDFSNLTQEDKQEFIAAARYLKREADSFLEMWANDAYTRAIDMGATDMQARKAKNLVYNRANIKALGI